MSIERWEMLLSSRADRYILKIRGPKADVDKIIASNPRVCQDAQEISDPIFQWVIFVVDANQAERLAIQNQLIAMTAEPVGTNASADLSEMLTGLSDALEGLTNLTAEEQAFVSKKMLQVQEREAAEARPSPVKASAASAPAVPVAPPPPAKPAAPTAKPPRVSEPPAAPPSKPPKPAEPVAPMEIPMTAPPKTAPVPPIVRTPPPVSPIPGFEVGFGPEAPAEVPARPAAKAPPPADPPAPSKPEPPKAVPVDNNPTFPGEIVLDIGFAEVGPLPVPEPKPTPPRNDIEALGLKPPAPTPSPLAAGIEPMSASPASVPTPPERSSPASTPVAPPVPTVTPPPSAVPVAPVDSPTPPPPPVPAPAAPTASTPEAIPPVHRDPKLVVELKTPEDSTFKTAIFFPQGGDAPKQKFMNTLTDMAQKKSKKPMFFHIVHSQATSVTSDNAVEWIWTAKSLGADCFFVILPPDILSDFMEGVVAEARQAGLRCFLIPQVEIGSKLLYMDLMVELMLIKRKVKHSA